MGLPFPQHTVGIVCLGGCVDVYFFECLYRPLLAPPALTLLCCMERFHREPLPFSQAVLGQYQRCAPELGRGQKLPLVLGILLLLCCGQALPSDSSLATGAGDRCHPAKSLPRNLRGPTLVAQVSHQCRTSLKLHQAGAAALMLLVHRAASLEQGVSPVVLGSGMDTGHVDRRDLGKDVQTL